MSVGQYQLNIKKGADFALTAQWKDANGTPINLTGYTAALTAREYWDSSTSFFALTSSPAAGIVITAGTGTLTISLTAAQTAALTKARGVYDCFLTDSGGIKTCIFEGAVIITPKST
jgi:hypothetical protein